MDKWEVADMFLGHPEIPSICFPVLDGETFEMIDGHPHKKNVLISHMLWLRWKQDIVYSNYSIPQSSLRWFRMFGSLLAYFQTKLNRISLW